MVQNVRAKHRGICNSNFPLLTKLCISGERFSIVAKEPGMENPALLSQYEVTVKQILFNASKNSKAHPDFDMFE